MAVAGIVPGALPQDYVWAIWGDGNRGKHQFRVSFVGVYSLEIGARDLLASPVPGDIMVAYLAVEETLAPLKLLVS